MGFLQEEDVTRVTVIASNDIPAEVINCTWADWIFHRVLLLIYEVECCHCFGENTGINIHVNQFLTLPWSRHAAAFQQALRLFLYSAFNVASVLFSPKTLTFQKDKWLITLLILMQPACFKLINTIQTALMKHFAGLKH